MPHLRYTYCLHTLSRHSSQLAGTEKALASASSTRRVLGTLCLSAALVRATTSLVTCGELANSIASRHQLADLALVMTHPELVMKYPSTYPPHPFVYWQHRCRFFLDSLFCCFDNVLFIEIIL